MNEPIDIVESMDFEDVWRIAHEPAIYDRICDDAHAKLPVHVMKEWVKDLVANPHNHILLVQQGGEVVGCFVCKCVSYGIFEIHTLMTGRCRGADAIRAGKLATQYMLSLPDVQRMFSLCPANIPEAYVFARFCGWHKAGVHCSTWNKNGQEYPQRIVEVTKADLVMEELCH